MRFNNGSVQPKWRGEGPGLSGANWISRTLVLFFFAALFALPASSSAQQAADLQDLMACPPDTDGKIEYRARYLLADWVKSGKPGEPDLVVALLSRIVNRSNSPLTLPHPARAFHRSLRLRYEDGSLGNADVDVFPPAEGTPETLTLAPGESAAFVQGALARWAGIHKHQVVEKKVLVVGEVNLPRTEKTPPGHWAGCVESRVGDIALPAVQTSERYHPGDTLPEFAARMRKQAGVR